MTAAHGSTVRADLRWSAAAFALTAIASLATTVVLARTQPREVVAAVSSILSLVAVATPLVTLGAPAAVVPFVARVAGREQRDVARQLLWQAAVLSAAAAAVLAGVALAAGEPRRGVLLASALGVPAVAVAAVAEGAARATGRFGTAAVLHDWPRRLLIIAAFVAAHLAGHGVAGWLAVAAAAHTVLVVATLGVLSGGRQATDAGRQPRRPRHPGHALATARRTVTFLPLTVFGQIVPQAGVFLADSWTDDAQVARLAVAMRAYAAASVVYVVSVRVVAPRVARVADLATLVPWLRRSSLRLTGLTLAVAAALAAGGPTLFGAVFGAEYRDAWLPAAVAATTMAAQAGTGFGGMVLNQRGGQRVSAVVSLAGTAAFLVGGAFAAQVAGATGVAVAGVAVTAVTGVVTTVIAQRRYGVRLWPGMAREPALVPPVHEQDDQQG